MSKIIQEGSNFHFKPDMLDFMMQIRHNNNKAFMDANRAEYIKKMRTPYYAFIELAPTALEIDPLMEVRPSKVLSRIFRDTRFSKDKSPLQGPSLDCFQTSGGAKGQVPDVLV